MVENLKQELLFVLIFFLPTFVFAEVSGTQDLSVTYYHVDGNRTNSFYPKDDTDFLYEGNIDFTIPLSNNDFFGSLVYRVTDDRLDDPQDISLEKFFIGLSSDWFEVLGGDFYSSFSEYSLGNALKGLKLKLGGEEGFHFESVVGIDIPKWENLWEQRCDDSAKRYIWGFQLGNNFFDQRLTVNFNYGGALDDEAFLISGSPQLLIHVISIDGNYRINDILESSFEIARSFTDEDKRSDEIKTKSENAYKVSLDLNTQNYSLSTTYSRIGSHFNTTGGFSTQDLEALSFDGVWFLPRNVKVNHYLHIDRNNLSKHSTTTKQINPGVKFSVILPSDLNCEVGFDLRKRFSVDKSTNEKTYTYSLSLTKDFKFFSTNFGYVKTIVRDKVNSSQERIVDTFSLGFDGNFDMEEVKVGWNLSEDLTHDEYKDICEADFTLTHSFGLRLDFTSMLSLEAKVILSDNDYYLNTSDNN
ncbi:hypothetical protein J7L36_01570, partial [bacterium]|nr:hypothetical protein [bacterium]